MAEVPNVRLKGSKRAAYEPRQMESQGLLVGCDTGGTFTDFVMFDPIHPERGLRTAKVASTPDDPSRAILQGLQLLAPNRPIDELRHATTVATNAILEQKLGKVGYLTTEGFADTLWLGRGDRRQLYSLHPSRVEPPLESSDVWEVRERATAQGESLIPLSPEEIQRVAHQISQRADLQALALCLLHASLRPDHELQLARVLTSTPVFCSHQIAPGPGEYERGMTTLLAAALSPVINEYLSRLEKATEGTRLWIVHSSGGLLEPTQARQSPHLLALSGPAAGLRGALSLAQQQGHPNIITLDIGGTSSDVALCHEGELPYIWESEIEGYPLRAPSLEIHTIGSGGGSIAYRDDGGLLRVGPRSAGAVPGPACYGRGGDLPTVSDALCWAGYLPDKLGQLRLDREASKKALQALANSLNLTLDETALGILQVTVGHLGLALRKVSTKRGHDPREFTLLPFGGAGPMLACQVADSLEMASILVPTTAGVLSAWGALTAPTEREWSATIPVKSRTDPQAVQAALTALKARVTEDELSLEPLVARRYEGQGDTLVGPPAQDFHQHHQKVFGFSRTGNPVETVEVRWRGRGRQEIPGLTLENSPWTKLEDRQVLGYEHHLPVFEGTLAAGKTQTGPFLFFSSNSTLVVGPNWTAVGTETGHLHLRRIL